MTKVLLVVGVVLTLVAETQAANPTEVHDAIAWVNRERATHGLPPFKRDKKLTSAAMRAAKFRARHGIEGHMENEFALVKGGRVTSTGCAAWPLAGPFGRLWGSCCTYDSYQYAGAAWAKRNGKRYMHLYVR